MAIVIGGGSGNAISVNSTVGSAGQVITSDGTNASWATKGTSNVTSQTFVAPGTWTKPSTVVAIKVTVVGGGGNGGAIVPGPAGGHGGGRRTLARGPVPAMLRGPCLRTLERVRAQPWSFSIWPRRRASRRYRDFLAASSLLPMRAPISANDRSAT